MTFIDVKNNFPEVQKNLNKLSIKIQQKVVPRALNAVAKKGKTEMTRVVTKEFNIKRADVSKRLRIIRAGKKLDQWTVTLDPFKSQRRGRSLNLIRFIENKVTIAEGRRRNKAGNQSQLRFQIKRVGGKKIIAGAFIGNKGRTVFIRETGDRLPIKALSTIDVPQMFNTRRIKFKVIKRIEKEMAVEFDRAIKAVMRGF